MTGVMIAAVWGIILQVYGLGLLAVPTDSSAVDVQTGYGTLRGSRISADFGIGTVTTLTVDEFLGIPYAKPPVKELRFKPPDDAARWPGVRSATSHGPVCPQVSAFNKTQDIFQDEDCLYLNIYSPFQESKRNVLYHVMVFIHGGSYEYGTGNRYNGTALAQHGMVVVSINYRLGALGFLTTGSTKLPGNYGLLDQIQALKWIKDNIRDFRGDPHKVTIFGSSAGGASVGLLLLSPSAKGLFNRVIAESGTANAMWATHSKSPDELHLDVIHLAQASGCTQEKWEEMVECLQRLPWKALRNDEACKILSCSEVVPLFKPVIDNVILNDSVQNILEKGDFPNIPYMTGTVRAEFGDFFSSGFTKPQMWREMDQYIRHSYGDLASKMIMFRYTNWTHRHSPLPNNTHYYMINYDRAMVLSDVGLVAPTALFASHLAYKPGSEVYLYYLDNHISYHSVELNHVFGTPFIGGSVDEMGYLKSYTEIDRNLSRIFMTLWTDFAKDGVPTKDPSRLGFHWTPLQPEQTQCLHMRVSRTEIQLAMQGHLHAERIAFWNILVPNLAKNSRNSGVANKLLGFHDKTWIFFGLTIALLVVVVLLLCLIVWGNRRSRKYSKLLRENATASYSVNL